MNKKHWIILVLIFALAFFLRFFELGKIPPSLNWDEVSHSYNAYSILKTGKDEWGQFLPLANFRAYGDYPLPLYMYLSMPFIAILGLNEVAIRLPSAILGTLTVLIVYFLFKQVFNNSKGGFLAGFLLALSPWSILTSRQVIQSTPAIFFLALGIWLMLKGIKSSKVWLLIGTISLGLSAYAYHNTRILAPLFFILFIYFFKDHLLKFKTKFLMILLIGAVFFLPLVGIITRGAGSARSTWVGILDPGAINNINLARGSSFLPQPLPRLINNKITYSLKVFTENYLGYFNPVFLGLNGGTHYQFSIPHFGIVYPVELPFFYLGIIFLLFKFKKLEPEKKLLLGWLFLAPIPAAMTRDPYQVVRASLMMPVFYLITVYGLSELVHLIKNIKLKQLLIVCFLIIIIVFFARYLYQLFNIYPKEYSFAWQYGYKQAVEFVNQEKSNYDQIVITKKYGEPHEFLLFYSKYDPASYQNDPNLIRYEKSQWFWVDQFNKYRFVNDWEIKNRSYLPNTLLITSPKNYPPGSEVIKTINFLDGTPAFDVVVK